MRERTATLFCLHIFAVLPVKFKAVCRIGTGVDKGEARGGSAPPPPNELKDHPCEKMNSEKKLRGWGDDYAMESVPILSANYCKLPIKVLVLRPPTTYLIKIEFWNFDLATGIHYSKCHQNIPQNEVLDKLMHYAKWLRFLLLQQIL